MALASLEDIETALRRELTATESDGVDGLLETASDLVTGYLFPCPIPDPVPLAITRVVADMAAAVLNPPTSILPDTTSLGAGPFNVGLAAGATSQGPYLRRRSSSGSSRSGAATAWCRCNSVVSGTDQCFPRPTPSSAPVARRRARTR